MSYPGYPKVVGKMKISLAGDMFFLWRVFLSKQRGFQHLGSLGPATGLQGLARQGPTVASQRQNGKKLCHPQSTMKNGSPPLCGVFQLTCNKSEANRPAYAVSSRKSLWWSTRDTWCLPRMPLQPSSHTTRVEARPSWTTRAAESENSMKRLV